MRIECATSRGIDMLFRGALIETEKARSSFEVVLTTAHGLPSALADLTAQCAVIGDRGRRYRIEAAWRAPSPNPQIADDWAVLLTAQRMRGAQRRLPVEQIAAVARDRMAADVTAVRLPLLTAGVERECFLSKSGLSPAEEIAGLFGHSCLSWHGHSGSPILARLGGEIRLIGVHLGSRWFFEERRLVKLGRFVDEAIVEAIQVAANRGRMRDPGPWGRR